MALLVLIHIDKERASSIDGLHHHHRTSIRYISSRIVGAVSPESTLTLPGLANGCLPFRFVNIRRVSAVRQLNILDLLLLSSLLPFLPLTLDKCSHCVQ